MKVTKSACRFNLYGNEFIFEKTIKEEADLKETNRFLDVNVSKISLSLIIEILLRLFN